FSPADSPPFDKALMDGFAIGADDGSPAYRVVATVAAGSTTAVTVRRGECARIMTGAPLPPGTGRVIRREFVEERDGLVTVRTEETVPNVARRGEGRAAGAVLLTPRLLRSPDIGILAGAGVAAVDVAVPPVTGVLVTGSELVPPGAAAGPGRIHDGNGPQLAAQLSAMGCAPLMLGAVGDEHDATAARITAGLDTCDVLLVTGGVSVGDFDLVPRCLAEAGAEMLFHGIALKPGKPTLFARRGGHFVFGIPGNPVSAFVVFEVLVKPFLFHWMGLDAEEPVFAAVLEAPLRRRDTDRVELLPVSVREGRAVPIELKGSWHVAGLDGADGFVRMEKGVAELPEGTIVGVRPIRA
ncbi:MAG TPA: molybdopterin molybdotransferase MoeA, partial [Spirochaetia bacterium]